MSNNEQKYRDALERAKKYLYDTEKRMSTEFFSATERALIEVFPELARSKEENIWEDLIAFFKNHQEGRLRYSDEDVLGWLQRRKPIGLIHAEVENRHSVCYTLITDEIEAWIVENKDVHHDDVNIVELMRDMAFEIAVFTKRLLEQKYAEWTEEDRKMVERLLRQQEDDLSKLNNDRYGHQEIVADLKDDVSEKIAWLESLQKRMGGNEDESNKS